MNVFKSFRKLASNELIAIGDFHSVDNGETLNPIQNPETIGWTPSNFSANRSFWRLEHDTPTIIVKGYRKLTATEKVENGDSISMFVDNGENMVQIFSSDVIGRYVGSMPVFNFWRPVKSKA